MRKIKRINAIITSLLIITGLNFGFQIFFGHNGLLHMKEVKKLHISEKQRLEQLINNLNSLQNKVNGLDDNNPDLDLVEEQLRKHGYTFKDESVIFVRNI